MPADTIRKLPVFLLVSCSCSDYAAIEAYRSGIRSLRTELMGDPSAIEHCELGLILFGDDAWQATKLCPLEAFTTPILDPAPKGGSTLGAALSILRAAITREVKPKTGSVAGDFQPLVFVFTDSDPCDDWRSALTNLKTLGTRMPEIVLIACGSNVTQSFMTAVSQDMTVFVMKEMTPDAFKQFFRLVEQ